MRPEPGGMRTTRAAHLDSGSASNAAAPIRELDPAPWSVNGNSVLPEREMSRLRENALMYKAVSTGLSRRLAMLKYAANDGS